MRDSIPLLSRLDGAPQAPHGRGLLSGGRRSAHAARDIKQKEDGPEKAGAILFCLVASEGFEPPKLKTSDLQSDPFGRLGNLP
jgi:hypothetical protein